MESDLSDKGAPLTLAPKRCMQISCNSAYSQSLPVREVTERAMPHLSNARAHALARCASEQPIREVSNALSAVSPKAAWAVRQISACCSEARPRMAKSSGQ